ncbi:MAG: single-stranded DNA-binding protein [bacterium]|nr:single-stranded DNA-binding protein [bacterium]
MASLNRVTLIGNLTKDPETRFTPSGIQVLNFDLAVNHRYKDQSGNFQDETLFIRVVVWGKQAEICSQFLAKGKGVFVEGRLRSRSWETQDGQKRSTIEVHATPFSIFPLEKLPKSTATGTPGPPNVAPSVSPGPDEAESGNESVPF